MLKTATLLLFLATATICTNAQEKWFNQKISDKVSVNFPAEPKKINENNIGVNKDDVVYLITFIDLLKVTGMTKEDFNTNVIAQEFADEFMGGLAPTMPKFKFSTAKVTTIKDCPAYQVTGRNEEGKISVYMNIIFVDGVAHSLTCILPDGKDIKNKDKFLGEIYIAK